MINRDDFKDPDGKNFYDRPTREIVGLKSSNPDMEEDTRPSILLIGINAPTFPAKGILDGIRQCGYRPEFLDWQRLKMDIGLEGLRNRAYMKAHMVQPEFIICHIQNPEGMYYKTYLELQNVAPVVNLTVDCRENIEWMKRIAPFISLTCFSNSDDVATCEKKGIHNTVSLHSSCDYNFYAPPIIPYKNANPSLPEIVFIGGNYENTKSDFPLAKQRQEMIEYMKHTYGSRFESYGMGQGVSRYINEFEELALYHNAKIVISHNNFLREGYSSDRLWRAMGSGAFVLSSYFPGIEKIFEKEIHLDWWESFESLKNLIDYYLENDNERKEIAQAGCLHVRQNQRWADRIKVIIDTLKLKKHE